MFCESTASQLSLDQSFTKINLLWSCLAESLTGLTEDTMINKTRFDLGQRESPGLWNTTQQVLITLQSRNTKQHLWLRTRWQMWNYVKAWKPAAEMKFARTKLAPTQTAFLPKSLHRADLRESTSLGAPHYAPTSLPPSRGISNSTQCVKLPPYRKSNLSKHIFF